MSNYANLKSAIQSVIKTNGNNEITGQLLQTELLAMITTLGYGYQFMGVASPDTVPGTPDAKVFYIAYTPGVYTNFGGITVTGLCVLKYVTGWTKEDIPVSGGGGGTDFTVETSDLTLESGTPNKLKFADRPYNSQSPNGYGYKILRANLTFSEQVTDANTIYEIRYYFDNVGTVNLPENSILLFKGGKISGTTLNGNKTKIDADLSFILDIALGGTWNVESFLPEWFGAIGDGTTDDTAAFAKLDGKNSRLSNKTYLISNVTYGSKTCIIGSGRGASVLKQKDNSTGDFITLLNWDYGILKDLTIEGGTGIVEQNYQQALVKLKTTNAATSSYRSIIDNVAINNSMYNGLSILGKDEVDNGVTCNWNWIFTISNLFVGYCSRVCIYNKSTDNQFNNINASGGKLAGIIERGSSNNWVNLKVDGEPCSLCDKSDLPALLQNTMQGAAVIIDGSIVSFVNLDIQSSHICGLKIVSATRLHITGNMNNCALGVTDRSQKKFAPALYVLTGLSNSELSLRFQPNGTQYKQFSYAQNASVERNIFNFVFQPEFYGNRSYEYELMLCKKENIINDATLFPSSSQIKFVKNLLPDNAETSSIFHSIGGVTIDYNGMIFGGETPSCHMPNEASLNGYELLQSPASRGCRPGDIMMALMVIKPAYLPQSPTLPYFNVIAVDSNNEPTGESIYMVRQDNIQIADVVVGGKYIVSVIFRVPSTGCFNIRCYRLANTGEYYISNIKQYNLTDGIGFCLPKLINFQATYHLMDVLFASNNLAELTEEFIDIPVDMSLLGNAVKSPEIVTIEQSLPILGARVADVEDNITDEEKTFIMLSGYLNTNSETFSPSRTSSQTIYSAYSDIHPGDVLVITGEGGDNDYYRLYAFYDKDGNRIDRYSGSGDFRANPLTVTAPSGAMRVVVNLRNYNSDTDSAVKKKRIISTPELLDLIYSL